MTDPLPIAKNHETGFCLLPALANRHGLITGATGTGKTVTLQVMAERFSRIGVPVFMADVKGDLSGITQPGGLRRRSCSSASSCSVPTNRPTRDARPSSGTSSASRAIRSARRSRIWVRCCLSRVLNLNETQSGVLALVFKVADDNGLLLLDLKDLRAMLQHVGDHAQELQTNYGNVSAASVGAIQRGLLALEQQGAEKFIGEPMLNVDDLIQTGDGGRGVDQHPRRRQAAQRAEALLDAAAVAARPSCTSGCPRSATATSRSSSSSSTKRTCSSPTRRRRCSTRSSRSCA